MNFIDPNIINPLNPYPLLPDFQKLLFILSFKNYTHMQENIRKHKETMAYEI